MEEKHKKYFDAHPKTNEFHFTTDGLAFFDINRAIDHQKSLDGKPGSVKSMKRPNEGMNKDNSSEIQELQAQIRLKQEALLDANDTEKEEIELEIEYLQEKLNTLK